MLNKQIPLNEFFPRRLLLPGGKHSFGCFSTLLSLRIVQVICLFYELATESNNEYLRAKERLRRSFELRAVSFVF